MLRISTTADTCSERFRPRPAGATAPLAAARRQDAHTPPAGDSLRRRLYDAVPVEYPLVFQSFKLGRTRRSAST